MIVVRLRAQQRIIKGVWRGQTPDMAEKAAGKPLEDLAAIFVIRDNADVPFDIENLPPAP